MSNRLPLRDRMKGHPLMAPEECERCHKIIGPKECTYELGKDYVCEECMEDHFEGLGVNRESAR